MTFQPLLAATCDDIAKLRYPVLASPKLDGIRCVKLGGRALTRKLKPVPNHFVREWVEAYLPDGIDGELMLRDHRASFNEVSSAIMSRDGEPDFGFCAFDCLSSSKWEGDDGTLHSPEEAPFSARLEMLATLHDPDGVLHSDDALPRFLIVPHERVEGPDELRAVIARHLDAGYEGTMVRDPKGRYKFGRSTVREGILLKIKPHFDEEATVLNVVEQMHNTNEQVRDERGYAKRSSAKAGKIGTGKLGALVCATSDGIEFEIGTGFTDSERVDLWKGCLRDRVVKFKHLGRLPSGAPRCPVFLGWRED